MEEYSDFYIKSLQNCAVVFVQILFVAESKLFTLECRFLLWNVVIFMVESELCIVEHVEFCPHPKSIRWLHLPRNQCNCFHKKKCTCWFLCRFWHTCGSHKNMVFDGFHLDSQFKAKGILKYDDDERLILVICQPFSFGKVE